MLLEKSYYKNKEKNLHGLRIHYQHIEALLLKLPKDLFRENIIGYSHKNVPIHSVKVGSGSIKILLWSQMHGDESTATKSLFDVFNYLLNEVDTNKNINTLLEHCTLLFIPMLNPDGAFAYTRENGQGIDLNRDAQKLVSPEAKLLMRIATEFKPNFAFNLHDQTSFYSVTGTDEVATLSFLSPASDESREITASRREAMSVISAMNIILKPYLPNQIGRYNDTFNADCFGDSFQMLNFPTILIESGYFPGDELREETRKFHFIALMSALFTIASRDFPNSDTYFDIPLNNKIYYDIRLDNILYDNRLTSVGIRFAYKLKDNQLVKEIDTTETISGSALDGKLFHKTINAQDQVFTNLNFLNFLVK